MRLIPGLILTLFLFSCSKTDEPQLLHEINEVSGRVKQIVSSLPNATSANISTYEYDNQLRITTYKNWSNDSSMNPMIQSSDYFAFSYIGNDNKPESCTHTNHTGSVNETTYYSYDVYNRLVVEETYRNGALYGASTYNYLSNMFTRITSLGTVPQKKDTAWLDSSRNIIKMKSYSLINPGQDPRIVEATYDAKKNPIGETNIGIFVKNLFLNDTREFYLTPNNLISQDGNINGIPFNTTIYYNYSTNGFPVKATLANNIASVFQYF